VWIGKEEKDGDGGKRMKEASFAKDDLKEITEWYHSF